MRFPLELAFAAAAVLGLFGVRRLVARRFREGEMSSQAVSAIVAGYLTVASLAYLFVRGDRPPPFVIGVIAIGFVLWFGTAMLIFRLRESRRDGG